MPDVRGRWELKRHMRGLTDERGYALMTVTIFAFVIILAGIAFFGMSSGETRNALYRQNSSEAFYLADGAIERARAKFLEDRSWVEGWTDVEEGRGTYSLLVERTPWPTDPTLPDVVRLESTGIVRQATRKVEVYAQVPQSAWDHVLLIYENAYVEGNLCLDGSAHVNGTAVPLNLHPNCGDDVSTGFRIDPPEIHTEPGFYPNTTYYYAVVEEIGGAPGVRVYDRHFQPVLNQPNWASWIGTPPNGYPVGRQINFVSDARLREAFDEATGVFSLAAGDQAVVVNFGLESSYGLVYLNIDGGTNVPIRSTIINTRFTGWDRLNSDHWTGGWTYIKQVTFEPRQGIGLIIHNFQKTGGSLVLLGTDDWPCLVYITGDVASMDLGAGINSNFVLTGSLITLGSWVSTGGPDANYDPGFLLNLPEYLVSGFNPGSGTLKILQWREIAAGT